MRCDEVDYDPSHVNTHELLNFVIDVFHVNCVFYEYLLWQQTGFNFTHCRLLTVVATNNNL